MNWDYIVKSVQHDRIRLFLPASGATTVLCEIPVSSQELLDNFMRLKHRAICKAVGCSVLSKGQASIFFQDYRTTLGKLFASPSNQISIQDLYNTFEPILEALLSLHKLGLAHGAVVSSNVVNNELDEVLLFGIKAIREASQQQKSNDLRQYAQLLSEAHQKMLIGTQPSESFKSVIKQLKCKNYAKQIQTSLQFILNEPREPTRITEIFNVQEMSSIYVDKCKELDRLERMLDRVSEIAEEFKELGSKRVRQRSMSELQRMIGMNLERGRRLVQKVKRLNKQFQNVGL